jgi:hypothetical protein
LTKDAGEEVGMPLKPYDWNVVVLGHWNQAILTPQGIAERLFQLPSETEIGIEVPMDAIGPFRVKRPAGRRSPRRRPC